MFRGILLLLNFFVLNKSSGMFLLIFALIKCHVLGLDGVTVSAWIFWNFLLEAFITYYSSAMLFPQDYNQKSIFTSVFNHHILCVSDFSCSFCDFCLWYIQVSLPWFSNNLCNGSVVSSNRMSFPKVMVVYLVKIYLYNQQTQQIHR